MEAINIPKSSKKYRAVKLVVIMFFRLTIDSRICRDIYFKTVTQGNFHLVLQCW